MKKITALILVMIFALTALTACGDEPSIEVNAPDGFIKIDEESVAMLNAASGAFPKNIDTAECRSAFVEAYNTSSEILPYDVNDSSSHKVVVITTSGEKNAIYLVSRLGNGEFNVSVDGSDDGVNYKFRIENDALEKVFSDELLTIKELEYTVHVEFVLSEGTPDADGVIRQADEKVGECDVKWKGLETNRPTAAKIVRSALEDGGTGLEYTEEKGQDLPKTVAGYGEDVEVTDTTVERNFWKYILNGEDVGAGGASGAVVSDGDTITAKYVHSSIKKEQ